MTEAYNDALKEQARQNIWSNLRAEARNMSPLEYSGIAADLAGFVDPTPTSDAVGALLSLAQGDLLGAGLSVVGMVPYVGDLGKIGKIAKHAPRTAAALRTFAQHSSGLARAGEAFLKNNFTLRQVQAARARATERVRRALLNARSGAPCRDCAKLPNQGRRQLQMPSGAHGRWNTPNGAPPANGNGTFTLNQPVTLPDGRTVTSVQYRDGFPNFDNYTVDGKHSLWEVSGNARTDGDRLTRLRQQSNPAYRPPSSRDYVLHHFEDGKVGYVPRAIHDRGLGGVAHSGGNSIVNNDLF